jgi:hypothetical protein
MNLKDLLGPHPASTLVALAVAALAVRVVIGLFRRDTANTASQPIYFACFFSGVLAVNAVPHFVHGISGEAFPAPFGYLFGEGFASHLSNVFWGLLNAGLAYYLYGKGGVARGNVPKIVFFSGALAMSVLLTYIFSRNGGV